MCVLSIKVPVRKKSGNLFNDSRPYIFIYITSERQFLQTKGIYISHPQKYWFLFALSPIWTRVIYTRIFFFFFHFSSRHHLTVDFLHSLLLVSLSFLRRDVNEKKKRPFFRVVVFVIFLSSWFSTMVHTMIIKTKHQFLFFFLYVYVYAYEKKS